MASFIGYVNTLVVGSRVLDKLPTKVFTSEIIEETDSKIINQIAGVKEEDYKKREDDLKSKAALQRLLKIMRRHERGQVEEPTSDTEASGWEFG